MGFFSSEGISKRPRPREAEEERGKKIEQYLVVEWVKTCQNMSKPLLTDIITRFYIDVFSGV